MVKTKILLVEDDKSLREIYGVRLYSEGYDIISAGDGEEALAIAIKERPPLIISDVMMPKISGFDMLDILRSTTETKDIKVIMMTALSSEDQRTRGEALGADRYLVKSQVGIEDVVRTVHEVLGDAPVAGAAAPAFPVPSAAPVAPTPVTATPPAPAAPAPSMFSAPAAPASPLPQPTAPFSTARPATLGDRVIHPIENATPAPDFSALMNAELGGAQPATPAMPAPVAEPAPAHMQAPAPDVPVAQPAPVAMPAPVAPEPMSTLPPAAPAPAMPAPTPMPVAQPMQASTPSGLSFEETPLAAPNVPPQAAPPTPVTPPQPPVPGV